MKKLPCNKLLLHVCGTDSKALSALKSVIKSTDLSRLANEDALLKEVNLEHKNYNRTLKWKNVCHPRVEESVANRPIFTSPNISGMLFYFILRIERCCF